MQEGQEIATNEAPEPEKRESQFFIGKFNQFCCIKMQVQSIL
jgi:hypothetical protein